MNLVLATSVLAIGLASGFLGCSFDGGTAQIEQVVQLCGQIALPNSMARPAGFDINEHIAALAKERERLVAVLRTSDAREATRRLLASEHEELRRHCKMTSKDRILDALKDLPSDATVDDAIERLVLFAKVQEGLVELDRGARIPHEEVRRRLGL